VTTDEDRVALESWIVIRWRRYCGEQYWRSL